METVTTISLDIAKSVFQVHGVYAAGELVIRKKVTRGRMLAFFESLPRCLVGIEACSSSHYWARELIAQGHDVRLLPAQYVKPYVKRAKNDAADAEAICEAVTRPTMRFVGVKTPEQQSVMMLHRVRLMLNRQRTQLSNAMRAHLGEFGIVAPVGRNGIDQLLAVIANTNDAGVPDDARLCLEMLAAQLAVVKEQILENDRRVRASARETDLGRRLMEIPGVGPLLASAFVATVADPTVFKTGRSLSAWIGLVPKQQSSGGKQRLGRTLPIIVHGRARAPVRRQARTLTLATANVILSVPYRPYIFALAAAVLSPAGAHARHAACPVPSGAKIEVERTVHAFFDALQHEDAVEFRRVTTASFYSFDAGKRFAGTELLEVVLDAHARGVQLNWSLGRLDTKLRCNVAWSEWENIGAAGIPPDLRPAHWLESAVLVHQDGRWQLDFFHSQRASEK